MPSTVTSQTHKHRRALADISHTHNPQYHKPSMSSTLRKQRKADDEENRATRSRTRNAARLGSALSLRSTVNSIAEDENPIPVTEDESVVSAFDTISEAPSFPPPTTVSSKTSRSSTHCANACFVLIVILRLSQTRKRLRGRSLDSLLEHQLLCKGLDICARGCILLRKLYERQLSLGPALKYNCERSISQSPLWMRDEYLLEHVRLLIPQI